jgi:hypothetical protein
MNAEIRKISRSHKLHKEPLQKLLQMIDGRVNSKTEGSIVQEQRQ